MSVINTNVMSLSTQLNLSRSQSALGTAIERLSSGMRINSAKDDAAGQAIANRFTSNIKGLAQARRNAMDGISIAQTTEGALNEINNNLQRVRELSVQAANGSNSQTDLDSIQAEVTQRLAEIDRISEQTQFNGKKVLAQDNELKLQVGAYDAETISVNLVKTNVKQLGLEGYNINGPSNQVALVQDDVQNLLRATNVDPSITQNTLLADVKLAATAPDGTAFGLTATGATFGTAIKKADSGAFFVSVNFSAANAGDKLKLDNAGIDASKTYYLQLDGKATATVGAEKTAGNKDAPVTFTWGAGSVSLADVSLALTSGPLSKVDDALKTIDTLRGDLGAVQNRLESTINNLGTAVNNLSASRSRIEDADYAVEVSNMSRAQILQQAGTSVLAQANQVPQTVLSLLR